MGGVSVSNVPRQTAAGVPAAVVAQKPIATPSITVCSPPDKLS